jgi:excisionase family DNA binding protein
MQEPETGPLVSRADKMLTVRESALILGVGEHQILRWIAEKRLPAEKWGRRWAVSANGLALMPRDSLKAAVDAITDPPWYNATTIVPWWKAIAAAALRVHAGEFVGGCNCEMCRVLRKPPL